jgi:hypothetical protein
MVRLRRKAGETVTHHVEESGFVWKDFSRYVEVHPVRTGWLVVWGRYADAGTKKHIGGTRTYADLAAARRRVADAAMELTHKQSLVQEVLQRFDRFPFPQHKPAERPDPL